MARLRRLTRLRALIEARLYLESVMAAGQGPVGRLVWERRNELVSVAASHGASRLRLFGSAARGDDRPDSDADLLVDLPDGMGLIGYGRLVEDLERVLDGVKVDLVPAADLKSQLRDEIEREAVDL